MAQADIGRQDKGCVSLYKKLRRTKGSISTSIFLDTKYILYDKNQAISNAEPQGLIYNVMSQIIIASGSGVFQGSSILFLTQNLQYLQLNEPLSIIIVLTKIQGCF
jgi:hypothetical protein